MDKDEILNQLQQEKELSPIKAVQIIQALTGLTMLRAIKGYLFFKNQLDVINLYEESILLSPQISALELLDPIICNHTTENKNRLEQLKITYSNSWFLSNVPVSCVDVYNFYKKELIE